MHQHRHVLALSRAWLRIIPGEIAAVADAQNFAETVCGEFFFRLFDELELHRLHHLAKKVAAPFSISRSWRRISFSWRNRFNSVAMSSVAADPGGPSIA